MVGRRIPLESYTKASFTAIPRAWSRSKELQPPTLISPPPLQNVFVDQDTKGVTFSWSPVDNVREYHIKINRKPSFAGPGVDDKKAATQVLVTNLQEGIPYYWQVRSIGQDGKESIESEIYRFTIVPKGTGSLALEVRDFVQMGHVIEVKGHTEPNARVMVNGQEAVVAGDGAFRHFTNPLPTGENVITITAQDSQGRGEYSNQADHYTVESLIAQFWFLYHSGRSPEKFVHESEDVGTGLVRRCLKLARIVTEVI